ncbi:hypothetical protein AV530_004982 [Patagioenas fasciata monilis]|uniref:Uncharacterized protein n=1 Tax=Patagioenas fasciata monilis TaxID=372326 RepID=A0A1V4K3V2_PATFA|nr:hypothetical protein AV530_004982 [Patagioenas fasciata monilis]
MGTGLCNCTAHHERYGEAGLRLSLWAWKIHKHITRALVLSPSELQGEISKKIPTTREFTITEDQLLKNMTFLPGLTMISLAGHGDKILSPEQHHVQGLSE